MDKGGWCCTNRDVKQQPSVVSERMVLRPLMAKDAPVVQRLARSRKVAFMKVEGRMKNAECGKAG
jgi:hypothetical protein